MPRPHFDPNNLPPRLKTWEVCELARYSRTKLAAQVKAGHMPKPIDPGRPNIYARDEVLRALGLLENVGPARNPWEMDPDELRAILARPGRKRTEAGEMTDEARRILLERKERMRKGRR